MLNIRQQFSDDLHSDLIRMMEDDVEEIVLSRAVWMSSIADVYNNYVGVPDDSRVLPWPNASDAFVPITMIAVETAHPRILSGIVGLDEMVTAVPTDSSTVDLAKDLTGFFNWAMRTQDQINGVPVLDRLLHRSEKVGKAISKLLWEYKERTTCRMYTRPRYQTGAGLMMRLFEKVGGRTARKVSLKQMEIPYRQHIEDIIGRKFLKPTYHLTYDDRTEMGFEFLVGKSIRGGQAIIPIPDPDDVELDIFVHADTIIRDAPTLTQVSVADFLAPVESNDLQAARCNHHRYWLTIDDLEDLRDRGLAYFDETVWEAIRKNAGHEADYTPGMAKPKSKPAMEEDHVRQMALQTMGDKTESDIETGFEVIESYYTYRMPGDSAPREYVFWWLPDYRWVYRSTFMEVICPTNSRPFTSWDFLPDDDESFESYGIGHIVMDIQTILNDVFNQQMDRDTLINLPFGFYNPTSGLKKGDVKIEPGKLVPTSAPKDIVFPNWNRPNVADMPYIQLLMSFAERLTSATNYFQGSAPSQPNAPRTFGATAAIIQEGQINFDLHIQRYHRSLHEVFAGSQQLYAHFKSEDEIQFMAPGAETIGKIRIDDLRKSVGLIFKSNATNTNKAVKQQFNMLLYDRFMANPLIVTQPMALYNITRRFALSHEYLEFDQDVPRPMPEMDHAPMDQMEEIEAMRMGQNISVLPVDNHQMHLQIIQQFMMDDASMEMSPESMTMLVTHSSQHQQMAAMMQRAAMTNPSQPDTRGPGGPGTLGAPQSEDSNVGGNPQSAVAGSIGPQ